MIMHLILSIYNGMINTLTTIIFDFLLSRYFKGQETRDFQKRSDHAKLPCKPVCRAGMARAINEEFFFV